MKVGAVIVAAGMSTRMGDFKQLMKIGDLSIAERVVLNFQGAGINDIVMVTGHRRKELEKALNSYGITFLYNDNYANSDMFESAKIGLSYMYTRVNKILFSPVDIPFFSTKTVQSLLDADASLACPEYYGKMGHPLCIDSSIVPDLLSYQGQSGLKGAFMASNAKLIKIPTEDEGSIVDADTKEDYEYLKKLHSEQLNRPSIKIYLAKNTEYFGPKLYTLLKHIENFGSVVNAAERSGISYSQAWKYINSAEKELGYAIVSRTRGGEGGGEAAITRDGIILMEKYEQLSSKLEIAAKKIYNDIF